MTTLRDRIAAVLLQYTNTAPANAPGTADAILALFRDEAPPSDVQLAAWAGDASYAADRSLYQLGHARGYAKSEAERAELQRLLECAQKRMGELHDALNSKLMALPLERLQQAERERDAALEELRQLKGQPCRATETALMRAERVPRDCVHGRRDCEECQWVRGLSAESRHA